MNPYYNRINKLAQELGFKTVNDFAKNGLKYNSSEKLNRLKKIDAKPSVVIILDILKHFDDVNAEWLLVGKGTMFKSESPMEPVRLIQELDPNSQEGIIASAVHQQLATKMDDMHTALIKLLLDVEDLKKSVKSKRRNLP